MTPERWQQVKELLGSALEHEVDERAAFLERACDGDNGLRREVESLLASFTESNSIIEMPVAWAAADLFSGGSVRVVGRAATRPLRDRRPARRRRDGSGLSCARHKAGSQGRFEITAKLLHQ